MVPPGRKELHTMQDRAVVQREAGSFAETLDAQLIFALVFGEVWLWEFPNPLPGIYVGVARWVSPLWADCEIHYACWSCTPTRSTSPCSGLSQQLQAGRQPHQRAPVLVLDLPSEKCRLARG